MIFRLDNRLLAKDLSKELNRLNIFDFYILKSDYGIEI